MPKTGSFYKSGPENLFDFKMKCIVALTVSESWLASYLELPLKKYYAVSFFRRELTNCL